MIGDPDYVDYPPLDAPFRILLALPGIVWSIILLVLFWTERWAFSLGASALLLALLLGTAAVSTWHFYRWFSRVRYELSPDFLAIEWCSLRTSIPLDRVEQVEVGARRTGTFGRTSIYCNRRGTLAITDSRGHYTLISPTNPEEMRDEILRRRDHLRGGSDA